MELSIKSGVLFSVLTPQMVLANLIVTTVFDKFGWPTIITSGTDGVHALNSLHYTGNALDYRTVALGIPAAQITLIATALQTALGPQYLVIKETNHIHVQFGLAVPVGSAARFAKIMAQQGG